MTPKKSLGRGYLTKERARMVGNLTKKKCQMPRGQHGGGGGGMGTFGFDSYIIMNHTRRPLSGYESSLLLPYFSFLLIFAQFAAKIPLLYYTVLLLSE